MADRHGCLADVFDRGKAVTNCIQCGSGLSAATVGSAAGRLRHVSGVNFKPLLLMSGGRMEIPIRLHSPTKTEIFSVLLISLLSKPAMNSTG